MYELTWTVCEEIEFPLFHKTFFLDKHIFFSFWKHLEMFWVFFFVLLNFVIEANNKTILFRYNGFTVVTYDP